MLVIKLIRRQMSKEYAVADYDADGVHFSCEALQLKRQVAITEK
jgi:hypothetical protein